jgi:hypothetical protein
MRKGVRSGVVGGLLLFSFFSCSTNYVLYSKNMDTGRMFLEQKRYAQAASSFEDAYKFDQDGIALTYLAETSYWLKDLNRAKDLISQAEKKGVKRPYLLRMEGYKALILLRKEQEEGLRALKEYVRYYSFLHPLATIQDVDKMARTGQVDVDKLEVILEQQMTWYEDAVKQFLRTGTGPFEGIYGSGSDL